MTSNPLVDQGTILQLNLRPSETVHMNPTHLLAEANTPANKHPTPDPKAPPPAIMENANVRGRPGGTCVPIKLVPAG